ncbi:MAG: leucyl aminopeptidase [Corynebacterium sp.]|nr:leucyl aminopeptidase [Corynebacterium sp.]
MTVVHAALPEVSLEKKAPKAIDVIALVTFSGPDGLEAPTTSLLDGKQLKEVFSALVAVDASGRSNEVTRVPAPKGVGARYVVAIGLGDAEQLDDEVVRNATGTLARSLSGQGKVALDISTFGLGPAVEGILLGGYSTRGIRSTEAKDKDLPAEFIFVSPDKKAAQAEFDRAVIGSTAAAFARTLVNTPANELYPESYANFLQAEGSKAGLDVEILDEQALRKQGFGGILAVGKGSKRAPRLVRMSWKPKKAKKSVALVGKGITFDTGGISLKPGAGMWDMISDMGGSAAVAGAIIAIAQLEIPVAVTATLPLAENMPSGSATRPGDVITHYGGMTSEVLNTDAEGRLVLADAIVRACEDKPDYLIETATLTGAQIVALGNRMSGVMGSDDFRDRVAEIGRSVGEKAWAVPLLEEHEEEIKSKAADIRNISGKREGGMQYAGTYLSKFVADGVEWVHIDVAGPAWNGGSPRGYTVARATGVPARTIIAVVEDIAAESK